MMRQSVEQFWLGKAPQNFSLVRVLQSAIAKFG
jgi:hypothetical protein